MIVKVIGNSCTWGPLPNINFVINNEIILDTPQSCSKFIIDNVDFEKIKYKFKKHQFCQRK